MGLYNTLPEHITQVDVIISGGGAAGCVLAGRLAEANPSLLILLIESGPNNYGDPAVTVPAFWLSHMDPRDKYVKAYTTPPSPYLGGREAIVPASRVLGGGSSINMVLYSRPQRSEIDAWKTPGWSAGELLKYMNKVESYHGKGLYEHHGHQGPIHVGPGNYRGTEIENDFITACKSMGFPEIEDINCLDHIGGPMRALRYVGADGKRSDTAHAYLHPKLQSGKFPNLHVLVESDVERILFDKNKKANGVVFRSSSTFQPDANHQVTRTVKAAKQVVVSAGALSTPLILERSGLGSPDVLSKAGVPLVAPIPGIGENYMDHHIMLYPYKSTVGPEGTMDGILSGRLNVGELIAKNDPLLSWNGVDVQAKVRPSAADIDRLGPEFQKAWNKDFKEFPDKPMMIFSPVSCFPGDPAGVPAGQYMGFATFSTHPFSRGRIHISGPALEDAYEFDTGFLAGEGKADLQKHVWMYKTQRNIIRRMNTFAGEIAAGHPKFSSGSKAAVVESKVSDVQNVVYSDDDDKVLEDFLVNNISTTWHSMGTCKMAPLSENGVVDPNLSVHGVQGLKIADLSIAPSNIGCNTCAVAMAIGEKAADIILEELRAEELGNTV